ncbi:hypothetical protein CAEBREN_23874 [Caenorhabditis brenneri]|uniref:Uncharacterized protein n=1 Tax=Caenorhabditis brenneri TaxID=135651 RepID=G0N330_CAEBE|nr:hypothetical protein CAEBREN_23874 [Caenorhabditis brenneri]
MGDDRKKGEIINRVISRLPYWAIGTVVVAGYVTYVWNRKSRKMEKMVTHEDIQSRRKENMEELRRIAARDEELSQSDFEKLMEEKLRKSESLLQKDGEDYKKYEEEPKTRMEEIERKYDENMKQLEENLTFLRQDEPSTSSQTNQMNYMKTDDTSSESSGPDDNEGLDFEVIENDEQYQLLPYTFSRRHQFEDL